MDQSLTTVALAAEHYQHQAARARRLAAEATTPTVRQHLRAMAEEFERLAKSAAGELDSPEDLPTE